MADEAVDQIQGELQVNKSPAVTIVENALKPAPPEWVEPPLPNPFDEQFKQQGVELSIPRRFLEMQVPYGVKRERLTSLPLEDSLLRMDTIHQFSEIIRNGGKWLFGFADLDNLKVANNFDKKFGDLVIRWGASSITQAVDRTNLPNTSLVRAMRQGGAADETLVWILGLDDEVIENIKSELNNASQQQVHVEGPKGKTGFTLSNSISTVTYNDPEVQSLVENTQKKLLNGEIRDAFELYEKIKNIGDYRVSELKVEKDLQRIPIDELRLPQGVSRVMELYDYHFGNSRVKSKTEAAKNAIISVIARGDLPEELPESIDEWVLLFREQFGTNDVLDKYFQ